MKNIVIVLATALLLLSSCQDYLDVNQNPNDATTATPNLVLPGALEGVAIRASVDVNSDYPTWMGYWAQADGWSGWFDIKQYQITTGNQQGFFNTPYSEYLMDLKFIETNSVGEANEYYVAVAKILKSLVYQYLVDAYGDVPYSDANTGIQLPKYDDGMAVYDSCVNQLNIAMGIIQNASAAANPPSGDIMFGGDMNKWLKFANTLKLKMLLRQAYVTSRSSYITAQAAGMDAIGFLSSDAKVNGGYSNASGLMQPYYATFGWNATGAQTNARTQYVMNAYIESVYNDLKDPRKLAVFNPANSMLQGCSFDAGTVVCAKHGFADGNQVGFKVGSGASLPAELSPYVIYYVVNATTNDFQVSLTSGGAPIVLSSNGSGSLATYSYDGDSWHGKRFGDEGDGNSNTYNKDNGNQIGTALVRLGDSKVNGTADASALVFSAFESLFLQAEAAERSIVGTPADAKQLYEDAVKANFTYLGLGSFADAYLASALNGIDYATATDKLSLIINQKYIAFCGINGFEAWCEYRRSGLIDTKAADPSASMLSYYAGVPRREIPHKMHYPQREFNLNNANVSAAVKKCYGGKEDDNNYQFDTRVFWDVTPVK